MEEIEVKPAPSGARMQALVQLCFGKRRGYSDEAGDHKFFPNACLRAHRESGNDQSPKAFVDLVQKLHSFSPPLKLDGTVLELRGSQNRRLTILFTMKGCVASCGFSPAARMHHLNACGDLIDASVVLTADSLAHLFSQMYCEILRRSLRLPLEEEL
ncbi:MAG: hypothetical protein WCG83_05430 [Candidatus Peregrinibacteria bacterium]